MRRTTTAKTDVNALLEHMSEPEQEDLFAMMAATDFAFYCEYAHHGSYEHGRHTRHMCKVLQDVEQGKTKRVIIATAPRHSKSMTTTETFPSWFIGRNPNRRVITVSYGESLARRYGRANLRKIEEFGTKVFGVVPDKGRSSITNWGVEGHAGGMISTGIGGAITGEGADLLVIDDPIKNRQEADSPTYRDMVWNEWQNTLVTRLSPNAAVILILTRWHEDDLAGRLLEQSPDDWVILRYPAIAEEDDIIGRQIGEPLWPEHGFDLAWAEEKKKEVGSYGWASLYQQRPSPAEGGILKREWWRYYKVAPGSYDRCVQSWDMSFKDNLGSSYVVGQVWGQRQGDKILLDQVRAHMDFVTTLRAVKSLTAKWGHLTKAKLIEDKANGTAVISALQREIPGIIPITPQGSKVSRANSVSPQVESGNVYLPEPSIAPWVHDFVEECAAFPTGVNDDQVDTMTQALTWLDQPMNRVKAGVWGR